VFGPVWTLLYAMMAVALWRVLGRAEGSERWQLAAIYGVQLVLNAAWSVVFFGLHSPLGGLVVIVALAGAIIATIAAFGRIDRLAAGLLVPYLLWVGFASLLNLAILILN